ncbi:MAG: DUF1244 domain-containing protein [Rhodospirillaceae bacterium]|jgi:uncharacterized protein|nr:DUF1244 domain-containing protein [Rhodospirillaceae bacterium]
MDDETRIKVEAAAFRGLVQHLQKHTDVQNIDLMGLSGFCRNCLAKWVKAASEHYGAPMDYDEAREIIYGMPYGEWKETYQQPVSEEQEKKFEESKPIRAGISVVE